MSARDVKETGVYRVLVGISNDRTGERFEVGEVVHLIDPSWGVKDLIAIGAVAPVEEEDDGKAKR